MRSGRRLNVPHQALTRSLHSDPLSVCLNSSVNTERLVSTTKKLVWTLWWHKQTAHHIPWIPQIHTRERWVASGPVTHFTQEFDGLCNTTGVSQILHPVCYLSERRCDDTTFVLINTSVTITNRHETCCRLQERILNTPLLSVIWLKQHTSPDFINTLLFHSSEHIRLIWLFYYRSHLF